MVILWKTDPSGLCDEMVWRSCEAGADVSMRFHTRGNRVEVRIDRGFGVRNYAWGWSIRKQQVVDWRGLRTGANTGGGSPGERSCVGDASYQKQERWRTKLRS